jgi:cholesterol transport system auxiliary component
MMFSKLSSARLLALPVILSLSACISFGTKAPPSMLVLTANSSVPTGTVRTASASDVLVIQMPEVPRKLDTNRVPVQIDASSIAFWADKPARLMQQLLSETVSAKTGNLVLSEVDAGGKAARFISGSLLEFGVDAAANEAVVVFDAVKITRGNPTGKRRFEARRPVAAVEATSVGTALNEAANDVALQIAEWAD